MIKFGAIVCVILLDLLLVLGVSCTKTETLPTSDNAAEQTTGNVKDPPQSATADGGGGVGGETAPGSTTSSALNQDADYDGVVNEKDDCPVTFNPDQKDADKDGMGDVCDEDDDNDGIPDLKDNCIFISNPNQANGDDDLFGDVCDTDMDNDGVQDPVDNCLQIANPFQGDADKDGFGDECDPDADNDGVLNEKDNCPLVSNLDQADMSGDGVGDVCTNDYDGDGIINEADNCPYNANLNQSDFDDDDIGDRCDTSTIFEDGEIVPQDEIYEPFYSATFTSKIFDVYEPATWGSISWVPDAPYYKELPNNGKTETVYSKGNINMDDNVLLLHMNEIEGGKCTGSGDVCDSSSKLKHGTNYGASYGASGKFNGALLFDGVADHVVVPGGVDMGDRSAITIAGWVNRAGPSLPYNVLLVQGQLSAELDVSTYGILLAGIKNENNQRVVFLSGTGLNVGEWHHVAMTYDGSEIKVYIDGKLVGTKPQTGLIKSGGDAVIGYYSNGSYFNGLIDDLAVFKKALSETEVKDLYQRGAGRIKFQVRTCAKSDCGGIIFVGPDGTAGTYYSESLVNTNGLPSIPFGQGAPKNRYLQYKAYLEADAPELVPQLESVEIGPLDYNAK